MRFISICSGIEAASVRGSKPYQQSSASLPDGMRVKAPTKDLAGQRFGRLVAIEVVGKSKSNSLVWRCKCDCGSYVDRSSANLRSKGVSSCGCYLKELGRQHLKSKTPWNKGKSYTNKPDGYVFSTKGAWAEAVMREKGTSCNRCGWSKARCDVHHIIPKSKGGKNTVSNGEVICPNCHRVEHETEGAAK